MKKHGGGFGRYRMDSGQHHRILVVVLLLGLLAFVPVGVRLYVLMVRDYGYYAALARKNRDTADHFAGRQLCTVPASVPDLLSAGHHGLSAKLVH